MYKEGVLDSKQMGGAFPMLRAHDLLWQPAVKNYLKGEREGMIDLIAWTPRHAHALEDPYRVSRRPLPEQRPGPGPFKVEGKTVSLEDIRVPISWSAPNRPLRAVEVGLQGERARRPRPNSPSC